MSGDEAHRPAASPEGVLAAVGFALVSLLLLATLPSDGAGTTGGDPARSVGSRPAGRP